MSEKLSNNCIFSEQTCNFIDSIKGSGTIVAMQKKSGAVVVCYLDGKDPEAFLVKNGDKALKLNYEDVIKEFPHLEQ